jgi:hypothetical protein
MRWAILLSALLLSGTVLAGCSSGGNGPKPTEQQFTDLGLQATQTTGVIRGVVVDSAVRPIANVAISVTGPQAGNTTTNGDGLFGLDGLAPGTYFVHAHRAGYKDTQTSTDVAAGVAAPGIVKLLLQVDNATRPYVSTYSFDGFIECSFSLVAVGFAACSDAPGSNDKFSATYTLDRPAQWAQSEMTWESTQAVSPSLDVVYSIPPPANQTLYYNYAEDRGASPLLLQANETLMASMGIGSAEDLIIRVFNEPIDGTRPPDPVHGDDCLDRPQLGGCATGAGATVQQSFTIITNVFYGIVPDPAWRYVSDGPYHIPA